MTDRAESQPELPGLELHSSTGGVSALRNAVITTLASLKADGLLTDRHAATAQLALELADAVAAGTTGRRASAAAMAAAQLLAALDALPKPMEADVDEKFTQLVDTLLNGHTP